jgi:hypothetical protein
VETGKTKDLWKLPETLTLQKIHLVSGQRALILASSRDGGGSKQQVFDLSLKPEAKGRFLLTLSRGDTGETFLAADARGVVLGAREIKGWSVAEVDWELSGRWSTGGPGRPLALLLQWVLFGNQEKLIPLSRQTGELQPALEMNLAIPPLVAPQGKAVVFVDAQGAIWRID